MRDTPILMNGPMVRATLADIKTVTRRPITDLRGFGRISEFGQSTTPPYRWQFRDKQMLWNDLRHLALLDACPYGRPGDRLYVRESLGYDAEWGHYYKAPGRHGQVTYLCELFDDDAAETGPSYDETLPDRGVPSIHLPRRYSRITLEVTGVRVERLQDITDAQCVAEGCAGGHGSIPGYGYNATPLEHFRHVWASTGGDWDANPWVWAIEFRRIEKERKAA